MHKIAVTKFTDPKMVENPASVRPRIAKSPPSPGLYSAVDSGTYMNQPNEAAPCGVRKPAPAMSPPNRYSQYESALSRGKATSGAPICSGMTALANAANSGVANSSSMTSPCMVNSWLYCYRRPAARVPRVRLG
jgi:hypothetical protein